MNTILRSSIFLLMLFFMAACQSQIPVETKKDKVVGGGCEGCEAVFEYGDRQLSNIDTLPDFEKGAEQLKITGTIFQNDEKTPAPNVILYIYHTDENGVYLQKGNEKGWGKRHGHYRGWIKTDASGKYSFYTFRPASYPNSTIAQHIHPLIKEPGKTAYYIDEFVFSDDPFFEKNNPVEARGGSGVLNLKKEGNLLVGKRDIVLGLNISGY